MLLSHLAALSCPFWAARSLQMAPTWASSEAPRCLPDVAQRIPRCFPELPRYLPDDSQILLHDAASGHALQRILKPCLGSPAGVRYFDTFVLLSIDEGFGLPNPEGH
jgi:hypothetical protein